MWKKIVLVVMLAAVSGWAEGITFSFANGTLTGTSPRYYEFDVMVAASASGTNLGDTQVYINYNTAAFGTSVVANNKVTATLGSLLGTGGYLGPWKNDSGTGRFALTPEWSGVLPAALPTTPSQLVHIVMEIADVNQTAGLSFQAGDMVGLQYTDTYAAYSPVTAIDTDDATLPVQLATFMAQVKEGVVELKWITASELNNTGFNIYRSTRKDADFKRINGQPIPGAGTSSTTRTYTFIDDRLESFKTYYYKLEDIDVSGQSNMHGPIDIRVDAVMLPEDYYIYQNYPNPFNPSTTIEYGLPEAATVRVQVYNLRGELVRTLINENQTAGHRTAVWNGTGDSGQVLPTGIYICRIQAGSYAKSIKMMFAK